MSVVILHDRVSPGAPPDEQDVLDEVAAVADGLGRLGHEVAVLPVSLDLLECRDSVRALAPEVAFNLVESLEGKGRLIHVVPSFLDLMGVPYTGSDTVAIFTTSHKVLAKRLMGAAGIPTPPYVTEGDLRNGRHVLAGPCIVKSVWEHASIGLEAANLVEGPSHALDVLERTRAALGGDGFVEEYVDGREFNVSLLANPTGAEVLPIAEMTFEGYGPERPRIVSYRAKWCEDSFEYRHTIRTFEIPEADKPLVGELAAIALRCWDVFELRGYARVDFRVDASGRPWVLEVNPNPCIAPDGGFVAAVERAGMQIDDALARILSAATGVPR